MKDSMGVDRKVSSQEHARAMNVERRNAPNSIRAIANVDFALSGKRRFFMSITPPLILKEADAAAFGFGS